MSISTIKVVNKENSKFFRTSTVLSGLFISIIRSEGAILSLAIFISLLLISNDQRPLLPSFANYTGLLGIYNFWRISYFVYLFPNPFYIKASSGAMQSESIYFYISPFAHLSIVLLIASMIGILFLIKKKKKHIKHIMLFLLLLFSIRLYIYLFGSHRIKTIILNTCMYYPQLLSFLLPLSGSGR